MPMPELSPEMMAVFGAMMTIKWLIPLVAVAEIVGGVFLAIPRYRALGALILLPVMVGIIVHHLTHDLAGIGLGLFLFLIEVWVIAEDKEKFMPLVSNGAATEPATENRSAKTATRTSGSLAQ